jgi:hypothetical protein
MRESWTDERLDDGFERVSSEIGVLRGEISGLRGDFVALQRTLQIGGGMVVALLGLIATLLGLVVTQL